MFPSFSLNSIPSVPSLPSPIKTGIFGSSRIPFIPPQTLHTELGIPQVLRALRTFGKRFHSIFFWCVRGWPAPRSRSFWDIFIPRGPWWEQRSRPEHGGDADSDPDPDLGILISLSETSELRSPKRLQLEPKSPGRGIPGEAEGSWSRSRGGEQRERCGVGQRRPPGKDGKSRDCLVWRGDESTGIRWECAKGDSGKEEENPQILGFSSKILGCKSRSGAGGEGWSC